MWGEIIYSFPNFNGSTVEMGTDTYYHYTHYDEWKYLYKLGLINVNKRGPIVEMNQKQTHDDTKTAQLNNTYDIFPIALIYSYPQLDVKSFGQL